MSTRPPPSENGKDKWRALAGASILLALVSAEQDVPLRPVTPEMVEGMMVGGDAQTSLPAEPPAAMLVGGAR